MDLIQARLDVSEKTRVNPFTWRGQFTPQFVDYMLEHYSDSSTKVLDPFAGSGTLLLECARKGIECTGGEINPAAYAMSKFYTLANTSRQERLELLRRVKDVVHSCEIFSSEDASVSELIREVMSSVSEPIERLFIVNCFILAESGSESPARRLTSALKKLERMLLLLPYAEKPLRMHLCDARQIDQRVIDINLVITSPPYINVFNYHQNYRTTLESLGWDMLAVSQSEFGANRKNRSNRFKTVIQYAIDMENTLKTLWNVVSESGTILMVVGRQSKVRGVPFYNGQLIQDIAIESKLFEMQEKYNRSFQNRFGDDIHEDILIFHKTGKQNKQSVAREVVEQHLARALNVVDAPLDDIKEALRSLTLVQPSPILSTVFRGNHESNPA